MKRASSREACWWGISN